MKLGIQTSARKLLLEVLVAVYVNSSLHQNEGGVAASCVARRKSFPVHTSHFMVLCMAGIVFDPVDAGMFAFLARLV